MDTGRKHFLETFAQALGCLLAAGISAWTFYTTFEIGWTIISAVLGVLATIFTLGWLALLTRIIRGGDWKIPESARIAAMIGAGVLWVCTAGLLLFSIAYLALLGKAISVIWFAPVFLAFFFFVVARLGRAVHRRRANMVLGYVEQAVRLNLPLAPMMEAAAHSEFRKTRRSLRALHNELDSGQGLEQALRRSVPEISPATLRAVGAAQRVGRLPHMLRRLTASAQGARIPAADLVALYRIYPALVFLMALVTGGVLIPITVWPKFEKILHDFHQPVPWSMRLLGGIAGQGTGSTGLAIVLILMGLLVLAPTSRYLAGLFFPTRLDPPFGGRVRDQLIWWTPVLRGDALDRGLADLCDFISDAADAGRPIDQALREASQTQTNAVMRSRTSNWAQAVEEGQPLHEAARAAGMPPLVVGMLATVRNTDDLAEVFSFLGRYYEFRFSRRRELLRALYIPLVVALMGGVVLLIALSIFQPMIALTMATARYAGGF